MPRRRLAALVAALLALTGCSAAPATSQGTPAPGQTVVAFYGDSYTLGTGASDPALRWSTMLSEDRGWYEVNPSVNGLGFVNNRGARDLPSEIIAADPDIVFVTMGLNDAFSYDRDPEAIRTAIDDDFARLKEALPDARFIVVEPFWYTSQRPASLAVIHGWVHDAAERIGADWIPGASLWIQGRDGEMAADGLHPNDDGYRHMYEEMDAALQALGL